MKRSDRGKVRKSDVTEFEYLREKYLLELAQLRGKYASLFVALIAEVATNESITATHN